MFYSHLRLYLISSTFRRKISVDPTAWKYTYILVLIAFSWLSYRHISNRRNSLSISLFSGALPIAVMLSVLSVLLNILFDFFSQFDHHHTQGIFYLGLLIALASLLMWNDQILRRSRLAEITSRFFKFNDGEEKPLLTTLLFSLAQCCIVPNYVLGPSASICIVLMLLFRTSAEQRKSVKR